jgi:hypothetical protein
MNNRISIALLAFVFVHTSFGADPSPKPHTAAPAATPQPITAAQSNDRLKKCQDEASKMGRYLNNKPVPLSAEQQAAQVKLCMETTDLMRAVQSGNDREARALIESGVDVNARNSEGTTALMFAAKTGGTEVVKALVNANANVDAQSKKGDTAMMTAFYNGKHQVVRVMLDSKADPNLANGEGVTPLMSAPARKRTSKPRTAKLQLPLQSPDRIPKLSRCLRRHGSNYLGRARGVGFMRSQRQRDRSRLASYWMQSKNWLRSTGAPLCAAGDASACGG